MYMCILLSAAAPEISTAYAPRTHYMQALVRGVILLQIGMTIGAGRGLRFCETSSRCTQILIISILFQYKNNIALILLI